MMDDTEIGARVANLHGDFRAALSRELDRDDHGLAVCIIAVTRLFSNVLSSCPNAETKQGVLDIVAAQRPLPVSGPH
jgi:hypothetical protein